MPENHHPDDSGEYCVVVTPTFIEASACARYTILCDKGNTLEYVEVVEYSTAVFSENRTICIYSVDQDGVLQCRNRW